MGWTRMPGLKGQIYIPDKAAPIRKKHGCKDCFSCQRCSDDRCRVCRNDELGEHRAENNFSDLGFKGVY